MSHKQFFQDALTARENSLVVIASCSSRGQSHVLRQAIADALLNDVLTVAEVHELLLQVHLFAGFPAAIEGLVVLREVLQEHGLESSAPIPEHLSQDDLKLRGEELLAAVYGDKTQRLLSFIGKLSPVLRQWIVIDGYGKVFGREGFSLCEKELCVIACLCVLDWPRQLQAHIRGGVRAGLGREKICAAMRLALLINSLKYYDSADIDELYSKAISSLA